MFIQNGGNNKEPLHFNTLLYTGILYYEMKDDSKAKAYLTRCLERYNQLPEANYYLALTYKRQGNKELEKKYLEMAKQSLKDKYSMNEDNLYYANYPHQIKLYEVEKELENLSP
ncbi:MAG TPA: tetratricopeptide repeat protein [Puia sp.]|nr:tetratricopeptide repeat protein [Puia sp.]